MSRTSECPLRNIGCNNQPRPVHIPPDGRGPIKSAARSIQGWLGNSVCRKGSGGVGSPTSLQPWQVLHRFSTCLSIPAHQTFVRSLCLVFTSPWWPSCAKSSTLSRSLRGISNLVPLNTNFPREKSSFLTCLHCGGALSQSPVEMHSCSCEISGSVAYSLSISLMRIATGADVSATKWIDPSASSWPLNSSLLKKVAKESQQCSVYLVRTVPETGMAEGEVPNALSEPNFGN